MPADFSVVITVRQQFGDSTTPIEPDAPIVGPTKDFNFRTPNVDSSAPAVLLFQARGVQFSKNVIEVNDRTVFGGIPVTPDNSEWNGNVMLLTPGTLRSSGDNTMHIEARNASGGGGGNLDDFIIDNAVVFYKSA